MQGDHDPAFVEVVNFTDVHSRLEVAVARLHRARDELAEAEGVVVDSPSRSSVVSQIAAAAVGGLGVAVAVLVGGGPIAVGLFGSFLVALLIETLTWSIELRWLKGVLVAALSGLLVLATIGVNASSVVSIAIAFLCVAGAWVSASGMARRRHDQREALGRARRAKALVDTRECEVERLRHLLQEAERRGVGVLPAFTVPYAHHDFMDLGGL